MAYSAYDSVSTNQRLIGITYLAKLVVLCPYISLVTTKT